MPDLKTAAAVVVAAAAPAKILLLGPLVFLQQTQVYLSVTSRLSI